jgi:hypothetical protein
MSTITKKILVDVVQFWFTLKMDTIKEYKTTNGYFFHTIVSKDGWIVAAGGPDVPRLNRELENLAGRTSASGHITSNTLNSAYSILKRLGMGHFIIKAPNNDVGLVIYNGWSTKKSFFKMANMLVYQTIPHTTEMVIHPLLI